MRESALPLAVELPVSSLQLSEVTDYDFVIASYCEDNDEYKEFYKNMRQSLARNRFMVLDNGAFENGQSMEFADYAEVVKELRPDQVVLPDVINDARITIEMSDEFLNRALGILPTPGYMGVLQGESINDYLYCLEFYIRKSKHHPIRTIGIPYHMFYRPTLLRKTNIIEICKEHNLLIHILGLPNPYEILDLMKFDLISSIDSSLPISATYLNMKLIENKWPLGERAPIDWPTGVEEQKLAAENILFIKELCEI